MYWLIVVRKTPIGPFPSDHVLCTYHMPKQLERRGAIGMRSNFAACIIFETVPYHFYKITTIKQLMICVVISSASRNSICMLVRDFVKVNSFVLR